MIDRYTGIMAAEMSDNAERVFVLLAESPNLAADAALVAALPDLDEPARRRAVDTLLERNHPSGLAALVGGLRRYDGELRASVVARTDDLFEATRQAMQSQDVESRLGAIDLIGAANDCRLAYLLCDALTRRCPRTVTASAAAILEMSKRLAGRRADPPPGEGRALADQVRHLRKALGIALDRWQSHFRTEVLHSAMMHADEMADPLFERASQTRSHVAQAVNGLLRGECGPEMAPFVLRALGCHDLRAAAAGKMRHAADRPFVEALLADNWASIDPAGARAMACVRELPWVTDADRWQPPLSDDLAERAMKLVSHTGITQELKRSFYERWLSSGSERLREAALWHVIELEPPASNELLKRLASGEDVALARISVRELFRRDPAGRMGTERPGYRPGRSDPLHVAESSFEGFWDHFTEMNAATRRRIGRRHREASPERFSQNVRARLSSTNPAHRLRALWLVAALNVAGEFETALFELSHDACDRVRGQAVSLLSSVEGATAVRMLRQALNDPHRRVQANAIDAIGEIDAKRWERELVRKLGDRDNRVSANAVRTLLRLGVREAAVTLITMLNHPEAAHRLSAVWVVEQMGLVTLAPRIRELAADDPDPRVRERAETALCREDFASAPDPVAGSVTA